MKECYVCLEETNEKSPCTCAAPIHESCFLEMQNHQPRKKCTICKRSFHIKMSYKDIFFCIYVSVYTVSTIIVLYYILVKGTVS